MKPKINFFYRFLASLFRFVLKRRYEVIIHGDDILKTPEAKLFLPNHPALIDPVILCTYIYKFNYIAPVITEKYYNIKIFRPLLKLTFAIPVADLSTGVRDPNVYKKFAKSVTLVLRKGYYTLFYPAGQLASSPKERLFNKQGAYRLVGELPDNVRVIAVRSCGLWGSRWSKARTGKTPNFGLVFLQSLGFLLRHGIWWCPKRRVHITMQDLTEPLKKLSTQDRKSFNSFLENFYNEPLNHKLNQNT